MSGAELAKANVEPKRQGVKVFSISKQLPRNRAANVMAFDID
jgi:hypothetical protein